MAPKSKRYFSTDIETTGQYPWNASMLSIGSCLVQDMSKTFYAELKPIRYNFDPVAIKIGSSSLKVLEPMRKYREFNAESEHFSPKKVLDYLIEYAESPYEVMPRFIDWVVEQAKGNRPILAASPIIFDGPFVNYYIDHFTNKENPFGYTGEDINSMFRGKTSNVQKSIKDLNLREKGGLRHNALEDALQQGREMYTTLVYMNQEKD